MAPDNINPTKTRQVFWSKIDNLRVVREPAIEEVMASGNVKKLAGSLIYEFEDHYLVVDDEVRKRDTAYYKRYGDFLLDADQRPAEEWLRTSNGFETEHGFIELLPKAPAADEALAEVAGAATDGNLERLVEIHEAEEQGWARPVVLETAQRAIEAIEAREQPETAGAAKD